MFKKSITFVCCFAIIFSLVAFGFSPSAYAVSTFDIISLWDLIIEGDPGLSLPFQDLLDPDFNVSSGCSGNNGGSHHFSYHASSPQSPVIGHYICDYCGLDRSDYIQSAYEDALATNNLSGTGYDSTGGLIWYPTVSDINTNYESLISIRVSYYSGSWRNHYFSFYIKNTLSFPSTIASDSRYCILSSSGNGFGIELYDNDAVPPNSSKPTSIYFNNSYLYFIPPLWPASYSPIVSGGFNFDSLSLEFSNFLYSSDYIKAQLSVPSPNPYLSYDGISVVDGSVSFPSFRVVPASNSSAPPSQQFYTVINNINTTSFNLATVENNEISNVYENTTVINNNNTTFTLPGGSSYPIDSWSFDFDNDEYTLVVLDGELEIPVTVRFGVDDLNIDFDGDTYNYKYVTEAATHVHTWELTSSTDPTCTSSGSKTYTCSGCNDVRTETVPALGHDWQLVSSVEDHYEADLASCACGDCGSSNVSLASGGENYFTSEEIGVVCDDCGSSWTILGSFVPGYEVYHCSRCQEDKTVSFGDPVDNSASGFWAWLRIWLENFKTWLGEKLDELLGRENNIIFEPLISPDIQITIPTPDIGFQYADEEGEPDVWHPSDLKEKFAFWADVKDIGAGLYASVQAGGEAPELIIHLGEANSPYGFHYGGDEYALDLSWYGPYKPTVDSITGGFLWLLYLYGVFKNLPNILSGVGMVDNRVQDIQSGTKGGRRRD